ncbi:MULTISPECIES: peptide ABC transporter substrate-binding protein [Streptomyces]|jgi:oligopeptide transport system substrate-binding protein|uniref:ABC transporter substrate-binding protein n=1 Tax=Streptomyces mirabilis TaxID=68239 RepID=A0ABU3ULW5_9ACTN|nr:MULTISPECIES: ABC transporter substrate-binding protein [Streptomyces]KPI21364.1 ABC-type transporter, periplasmic subunit [Actinobacteria bacterium OK006]KAF5995043.1 peptide ABC transporter substrate-binding protein [Streptomyces sp. WAC00263]MCX4421679.1 ABC transporter substrate-binding protein [Streptomyces mirabilis]MCX4611544.1 ABC transporter substrate-binding protein [Streptomyces mirabilis]MCX5351757.1 ABC transporter substrate-binding protein [Streptomyces mirabilis]
MRGAKSAKWVAIAAVVALGATACGGGGGDKGSNSKAAVDPAGKFSVEVGEPQNPLQPANTMESNGSIVIKSLFSQLVSYDDKGNIVYVNAQSVDTKDNKTYTVKLKSGWKFHDGTPVTATSYVKAWNWAAAPANKQTNSFWFSDIAGYDDVAPAKGKPKATEMSGLKVVDDNTFTITLSKAIPYYVYKLGYEVFSPLPESFYKDPKAAGEHPIGNGPYKFVSWSHKKQIEVAKFDGYQGPDKAKNGGVIFKNYTNLETAYEDLKSGNVDVLRQVAPKDLPVYKSDLGSRAVDKAYSAIQTITPAFYTKQWKNINPKVLQGLSMAIDRATITKTVLQGTREPATGWVAKGVLGYEPNVGGDVFTYNPTKAKQLIKDGGGVPGNAMTIQYNADGGHKEWVEAVCNSITNATGVKCSGDSKADFQADLDARDAHAVKSMYRSGWVLDFPMNANFIRDLFGTKSDGNTSGFSNKKIDADIAAADSASSLADSEKKYQDIEKELVNYMPSIPLWYYKVNAGYSDKVTGVEYAQDGDPILTGVQVKK